MDKKISRRKLARYSVDELQRGISSRVVMREVAAYLIDSGRTREVDLMVRAIEDECALRGTVLAHVTAAYPLTTELKHAVKRLVGADDVQIIETIKPQVIGGVRIETPGKMLDATIARKLLALRQAR